MDQKEFMKKYRKRLEREAWLRSGVCALAVGFACDFVAAFVTWFTVLDGLWLALGVGVLGFAVSLPAFYYLRFRPTERDVAKRLDALGLEERLITMVDYQQETSGIYALQRRDAQEKLDGVAANALKYRVSRIAVTLACILAALGIAMTVITALSSRGLIVGGKEFIENPTGQEVYYSVTYEVSTYYGMEVFYEDEGGMIEGEPLQLLHYGEDALTVVAVPDDGYAFYFWMDKRGDEVQDPVRTDLNICEDVVYTAVFVLVPDDDSESEEDDSDDGESGASDEPDNSDSSSSEDENSTPQNPPQSDPSNNNQIIDGETYYRDVLQEYYDEAMRRLSEGEEVSDEMREFIEKYFGIIL